MSSSPANALSTLFYRPFTEGFTEEIFSRLEFRPHTVGVPVKMNSGTRTRRRLFCFSVHEWRPSSGISAASVIVAERGGMSLIPRQKRRPQSVPKLPHSAADLGRKAIEYCAALERLVRLGHEEARTALICFFEALHKIETHRNPRKTLLTQVEDADATPVTVHSMAHWKLDSAGSFALELLLWLWCARRVPHEYGAWGQIAQKLPIFEIDTADVWWDRALGAYTDSYQKPQGVPELRSLITARYSLADSIKLRNAIARKLRDRFRSFARPR